MAAAQLFRLSHHFRIDITPRIGVILLISIPSSCTKSDSVEWQVTQSYSMSTRKSILALETPFVVHTASVNPSPLQFNCKEACEPISIFHGLRPSDVARYWPSAISDYRESACLLMTMKLICWPVFRSSFQDRSWRRVSPSSLVTWYLVSQTQSCLP